MENTLEHMNHLSIDDFTHDGQPIDSMYRLVILAAKRANQLGKPDARLLVSPVSRKPVITALQEILEHKVWYRTGADEADEYEIV
jgi:DNA-directed RNA polymerase omega subunit